MGEIYIPMPEIFDDEDYCLIGKLLPLSDRLIFWIGGSLVLVLAFFLILGFIRFKELRRQPGDLILGIALSDLILGIHWIILATWYSEVDDETFCVTNGFIGTLAGSGQYLYTLSFSIYLVISLRNALKQGKIPGKIFHVIPLIIALTFVIYLYLKNGLGKTEVGTCSIKSTCTLSSENYLGPLLVLTYALIGFYTFWYVRKNATKCAQVHKKRAEFLLYYLKFVLASTVIFAFIAIVNMLTVLSSSQFINSLYNISKLSSPLVLSLIRYNDPLIKKAMVKTFTFKRDTTPESCDASFISTDETSVLEEEAFSQESPNLSPSKSPSKIPSLVLDDDNDNNGEFIFNQIATNLKVCITYTLISCVLYAEHNQRNGLSDVNTIDKKSNNRYKHERFHNINDDHIKSELPVVKEELERLTFNVLPGTLKVYAPEVFSQFISDDKEFLNIQHSLDLLLNQNEINDASSSGGKSGEFFFFSKDKKLIIKTIPDIEMKMITNIVERYENHFKKYPNSLIAKIYGAFTFESTEYGRKFNMIVMKNISGFPKKYVERVYDLKGSTYDREVLKRKTTIDRRFVGDRILKDLDFERIEGKLNIKQDLREQFLKQVRADALFFREVNIMDYSFMVYCVNKLQYSEENGSLEGDFTALNPLASLENTAETGMYYNVGIGDYLQPYNFKKRCEKLLKRIRRFDMSLDTSSQEPDYYSKRFIGFLNRLTLNKDDLEGNTSQSNVSREFGYPNVL